nr:hypothetical protein [Paenibacillus ihumii]
MHIRLRTKLGNVSQTQLTCGDKRHTRLYACRPAFRHERKAEGTGRRLSSRGIRYCWTAHSIIAGTRFRPLLMCCRTAPPPAMPTGSISKRGRSW